MDENLAGRVIRAWETTAYSRMGTHLLSFPFDVKVHSIFQADGCARFEICSDYQPPPDSMTPREIWMRHFAWMRLRDPVHGGFFPPHATPERLFVHLFDPEPLPVKRPSLDPQAVQEVVSAWRKAMGTGSAITFAISPEQEEIFRKSKEINEDLDILVTSGGYPAHHPGLAFARGLYPYDFSRRRYAWTDFETLRLFALALQGKPESARMAVRITGSEKAGIARLVPFSVIQRKDLEAPEDAQLVQGGLLTGESSSGPEIVAWPQHDAWTFLRASESREFLWFMNPGFRWDSSSPLFASRFLPFLPRELGADLRGEKRFCIACNRCETHCPAGLDPQHLWKCLSRGFDSEAEAFGLGRCLECGLCAYACPSKIELLDVLRSARARLARRLDAARNPEERP